MPKKRYNAEEIIHRLREADVLLSRGMNIGQVSKRIGIAEQTYYRTSDSCCCPAAFWIGSMATFGPASLFVDGVHHHGHAGAFIVGAAVGNAAAENDTETVVVKEPTYVYHVDPVPAPAPASAQSRLAEAKSLFDQGLISEDEYPRKREQILAAM